VLQDFKKIIRKNCYKKVRRDAGRIIFVDSICSKHLIFRYMVSCVHLYDLRHLCAISFSRQFYFRGIL
jgi:hypothetical protein